MAAKLKIPSHSAGTIRHVGVVARTVNSEGIAKALGAEVVSRKNISGAPINLHALRQELHRRVRSTGGRPALEGATRIQKIPLTPGDWSQLGELADVLSRQGVSATAGQVASVIVHNQLLRFGPRPRRAGRGGRRG